MERVGAEGLKRALCIWWPLLAWATIIASSSSSFVSTKQFVAWMTQNTPLNISQEQFSAFWKEWWWVFVKGFHVLEFTVLFLLLCVTIQRILPKSAHRLLLSYSLCAGYAGLDEWHQTFVPLRGGRTMDFLIDMIGPTFIASIYILRENLTQRAAKRI